MNLKDLDNQKVLELRKYARELKIPKYSRMRKEEIIERILKLQKGGVKDPPSKTIPKQDKEAPFEMLSKREDDQLDRTEAETRLKMKEAFSSSAAAQKEYFHTPKDEKKEHKQPKPRRDKFATGDLPYEYHKDRVMMLIIDPTFFYSYWEITQHKLEEAKKVAGWDSNLTLRVYDVTDIHFNGLNAHTYVDMEIYERIGCWYIRLDKPNRDLVIDIGFKNGSGHFHMIARSNYAKLPPLKMAPEGPIKWMAVDDLGNYVITDIEEYTEADMILLRKILGEALFRKFLSGEFRGMLFSTIFKKVPNIKEISLELPTSAFSSPTSSNFITR